MVYWYIDPINNVARKIKLLETQKPPKGLRAEEEKRKRGEGGKCLFCYVENIIQAN